MAVVKTQGPTNIVAHCVVAGARRAQAEKARGLRDATTGLGLAASRCDAGASAGGLIDCVYASVQCVAETAVAETVPRAPSLFDELTLDAYTVFPCLMAEE
jgi:hypothetical protein